jgi:DNA anti-recombination protein RmuC
MKENNIKTIIEKLNEVKDLLEQSIEASNMDVEFMMQRVEDMVDEFEGIAEFKFEEEEED